MKIYKKRAQARGSTNFVGIKHRSAQAWGYDFIAGMSIFVIGIFIFFLYSLNYNSGGDDKLQEMQYEASVIGDSLLSEGYPEGFTDYVSYEASVQNIGLLTEGKINQTKLSYFYELANDGAGASYAKTKGIFNVKDEYWVSFGEVMDLNLDGVSSEEGIGKKYAGSQKNLVKDTRIVSYNNKIRVMNIYVWD